MKRLLQYTLCSFLLLSNAYCGWSAGGDLDGKANKNRKSRHYSKRRYYTKQIDLFDSDNSNNMKVPEEEAPKFDDGQDIKDNGMPAKNISPGRASPRLPAPAKPRKSRSDKNNNWLVEALINKDEKEDSLNSNQDQADANWGWLAREADITRQQQAQDELEDDENLNGYFKDGKTTTLERILARSEGYKQNAESYKTVFAAANDEPNTAEMYRDHDEEEQERFEIFKSFESDNNSRREEHGGNGIDEKPQYAAAHQAGFNDDIEKNYESDAMTVENPDSENGFMKRSVPWDRPNRMAVKDPDRAPKRRENRIVSRRPSYQVDVNEGNRFGSAFNGGMSSKLRSPFKSSYQSSPAYNANSSGNNNYSSYGSPYSAQRPSSGYSSNYSPSDNTSYKPAGGHDKFENTKKRLPYSVNQWD